MSRSFAVKPGEIQNIGVRIDAIYNGKKQTQWFVIREVGKERILFPVTQPTLEELSALENPEEYKNDLL